MPKNCSTCADIDKIEELSFEEMTADLYKQRYSDSNRPVIIRNVSSDWPAINTLDYHWLRDQYTASDDILDEEGSNCFFKCYKTDEFKTLRDVFQLSPERLKTESESRPWYVGWTVCHKPVLAELNKLVELPSFLSEFDMIGNMWIFIGTPGYGAHLHLDDDLDTNTWQAQISGVKTWFLEPPPECAKQCHQSLEADLYPGDMIIVNTNFWYHRTHVQNHGISLVITQQIG